MKTENNKRDSAKPIVEKPSVETRVTFWDWEETSRPELRILSDREAVICVGGNDVAEVIGKDKNEFVHMLEGWRDIISCGVNLLNAEAEDSK
jgi:hypothetical protein